MTLDQIDQMVRAANPVPDPTALESNDPAPTAQDLLQHGATVADLEASPGARTKRRSRLVAAAAVAAAMLLVTATVLIADRGRHARPTRPANPSPSATVPTLPTTPSTTVPLLPKGAASLPSTGELVAAINVRHRGVFRLYADGRLIDVWPAVEQRLTPEGVERVRSRFLSSGLFDSAQPVSEIDGLCPIRACVRDDDHWLEVQVDVGGPTFSRAGPEAVGLFDDLERLASWLPATEWADQRAKPYVSPRIGTCVGVFVDGGPAPFDRSVLLSRLPERAAGVLSAHERSADMESLLLPLDYFTGGRSYPITSSESGCFELTLNEARTLADALLAPPGGGTQEGSVIVRSFGRQSDPSQPGATRQQAAHIGFFQLLPDKWPFAAFGD
jgi:hypothetical protein